ncbi:acyltransferase [Exiguobacterium sp. U13-1]|uniref:Acyltransferase n=2 Tax=Exiguobacterium TaxID=33986 RepID=A0ABX8GE82_EXIAC|nr:MULTISPECIES: acyltransferase family protein [Exiguobacterium]AOT00441.1 acyltransferase [Exiguobacterium sp. U13-1]QWB31402.1 acyltransferase [Exiguobacterium acetylicum]
MQEWKVSGQPGQKRIDIESRFRPEIEGLRTVAALLVAIYHIWFNRVSGGVDVFFVISGFLITTSIISTINRTGEFKFLPYVTKLLKRLLPSVLFILGVVLVLSTFLLPASILGKTIREVVASMFFYQNWQLAVSSTDYLDATQMKSPVEHFWALSIQWQFYMIWFVLFSFILWMMNKYQIRSIKTVLNGLLGFLFVTSLAYSIYLTEVNQPWAYFITPTRVWEFALGSLLCVNLSAIRVPKWIATIIGWVGLLGLLTTGVLFNVSQMFPGYIALWPMTCALMIVLSGTQETRFGLKRFLGSKPMVKLGGIAFGIYLWHWVLLEFYRYNVQQTPGLLVGTLIIVASIGLSYLMTEWVEKPIRTSTVNRTAFKKLGALLTVNVLLIGSLLGLAYMEEQELKQAVSKNKYPGALAIEQTMPVPKQDPFPSYANVFNDLPLVHTDGSNQGLQKTEAKVGEYGKTKDYKATIALVGSSHSEQWFGALHEAIKGTDIRLLNLTRSGTRFSTGYEPDSLKGIWNQNVLNYLKDADVDLIISHVTAADASKDSIHQQMVDQMQFVKDEYGIDGLALRDNPRYDFNVLEALETTSIADTTKQMNTQPNQTDEAYWKQFEKTNQSLHKLDLTRYFHVKGEYRPVIGNVVIYRDNSHMTNTYAESFAPMFKKKLDEVLADKLASTTANTNQ